MCFLAVAFCVHSFGGAFSNALFRRASFACIFAGFFSMHFPKAFTVGSLPATSCVNFFTWTISMGFFRGGFSRELFLFSQWLFAATFSRGLVPCLFTAVVCLVHSVAGSSFRAHFRRSNFSAFCCWEKFGAPFLWGFFYCALS